MGELATVRLADVADLSGGYAFKSEQYRPAGHFVLRTINIRDDCSITRAGSAFIAEREAKDFVRFALREHDTLFVMVGATLGKVGYIRARDLPALLNQNMWVIRAIPGKIDPVFLHYCFRELSKASLAWVGGSARGFLRRDDVRNLTLRIPPLSEQRALADLLQSIDDKIELNRGMNETLEATTRAIFKDWFIDFGPTCAKKEGRLPYLAPDIWTEFPERLDDKGLPYGWAMRPISEIANVIYGAPFASAEFNSVEIGEPLVRIRDLPHESPSIWTTEKHPKGYKVAPGDIVVGMDGEFRAYLWGGPEGWLNQRVCVFGPKMGASAAFVRNSIIAPLAHVEATEIATTVIHLGKNDIDRFSVLMPSAAILSAFNALSQPLYDRIVANKLESRTLAATRDLLLPKVMSADVYGSNTVPAL